MLMLVLFDDVNIALLQMWQNADGRDASYLWLYVLSVVVFQQ